VARNNCYPDDFRKKVVAEAAKLIKTSAEVADKFDISKSSVQNWCKAAGVEYKVAGIGGLVYDEAFWKQFDHLFGTMSEYQITKLPGAPSMSTCRHRRIKLGFGPHRDPEVFAEGCAHGYPCRSVEDQWLENRFIEDHMYLWKRSKPLRKFISDIATQPGQDYVALGGTGTIPRERCSL